MTGLVARLRRLEGAQKGQLPHVLIFRVSRVGEERRPIRRLEYRDAVWLRADDETEPQFTDRVEAEATDRFPERLITLIARDQKSEEEAR